MGSKSSICSVVVTARLPAAGRSKQRIKPKASARNCEGREHRLLAGPRLTWSKRHQEYVRESLGHFRPKQAKKIAARRKALQMYTLPFFSQGCNQAATTARNEHSTQYQRTPPLTRKQPPRRIFKSWHATEESTSHRVPVNACHADSWLCPTRTFPRKLEKATGYLRVPHPRTLFSPPRH